MRWCAGVGDFRDANWLHADPKPPAWSGEAERLTADV
jgi:hypothetical protein